MTNMKPKYFTVVDRTLVHQVVLYFTHTTSKAVAVSCNCLGFNAGRANQYGPTRYPAMGISSNLDETRALYNDPTNHIKPFTDEDKAKW